MVTQQHDRRNASTALSNPKTFNDSTTQHLEKEAQS